ncbi:hypothetical protein G7Y89_g14946 [Cudoniella acicularis]|uniref:Uncharacterized protein n=1 Tax=Cudoniella acicularis TaxID=354080 RepID=A0A8H4VQH7_9HELO|nr:hypothetical protein G7Y89_g14946 [Cudoniella acicularis]
MSGRNIALSPDTILNTVGQAPSRDGAPVQSLSMAPANILLASRPRTFDLVSEPVRVGGQSLHLSDLSYLWGEEGKLGLVSDSLAFKIGHNDSEDSYIFTPFPSARITSNRSASQAFPTNTAVHLAPLATRNPPATPGQEMPVRYEITQSSLKFKGDVNGIKIVATQVASKVGQDHSEYQLGDEEQNSRSQGQGKQNGGFVNQNGARFSQSVTDTETEVSQSVGGNDFFTVTQDAAEVEGDVSGGSFVTNQRVW